MKFTPNSVHSYFTICARADEIKCEECGQTFLSDEELEEHVKQHERASALFQCDKCKMSFGKREELERHVLEVHGNKN